ncbi:hypothetical protein BDN70DRAFT_627571 [Pholiota conissans]|uniref:RNA-dependent RNA polymerase n=1 Tax=Pholiota conissans TaxID=109636 RepID=A0A9P5ZBQ2_9AGAR|nr:hypothetical protein BDN70DRAFT_627571 [Pholiota conissans]
MVDINRSPLADDADHDGDRTLLQDTYNVLNESLIDCSQQSSYSQFGEADISDAILAYIPATQAVVEPAGPPDSSTSETSLGKRKASDISTTSSMSTGPFRPSKLPRPFPTRGDNEENPFLETSVPVENPFAPISIASLPLLMHTFLLNALLPQSPTRVLQRIFDAKKVPYGVQYEIARYVSLQKLQYKDVLVDWLDEVSKLNSNREAVPALSKILASHFFDTDYEEMNVDFKKPFEKELAAKTPWMELDREEEALSISPYGGLGFGENGEYINWFGGQVLFHGKLQDTAEKGCKKARYKILLERAELGPSNMFARRFGSKHFFRLKLTKAVLHKDTDGLLDYLRRPLILCGSVFRAFFAKNANVFFVKTNEPTDGTTITDGQPIPNVLSLLEFLEWHNPMECNMEQTMAKYVSRFGLGLSNSVPGLKVDIENIKFIDDIVSASDSNMTDGAGLINRWSLNQLRFRLDWEDKPTAIQTRIFGTKGLLIDHGGHTEQYAYVELTPSQRKIKFLTGCEIDPAHRIIDVLRSSHTKTPCHLSVETIINLASNGVKKEAFCDLLKKGLAELIEPLLDWESPDAMRILWSNVRRLGGVMAARRAREAAGMARVLGYSERDTEDDANDEDAFDIGSTETVSSAWWGDEISGCPSGLEETVMYMIDAGFTPLECPLLKDKLDKFIRSKMKSYIKNYRIVVPMSASAFLVPDRDQVLEPGEVFFKSSRREFRTPEGMETDIYIGDVLVTRHPCKLPTDIQKWKSVDKPALYHYTDVIVLSTKGNRRAADFLSGGDYDGDKGTYIWQPELVEPFKNAPLHFSEPPADIKKYFARENEEAKVFHEKTKNISPEYKIRQFQLHLLGAIRDPSIVGKYSTFHEIATYTLGYGHPETKRLAYMFCMALDGVKTGMTVSREVLKQDTRKFQKRPPLWKETDEDKNRYEETNESHVRRPRQLGHFIMDDLYKQADEQNKVWNVRLDEHFKTTFSAKRDEDLAAPWDEALARAKRWKSEENVERAFSDLEKIRKHVEVMYTAHREMASSPRKPSKGSPKKDKLGFTVMPIEVRQDKMREMSRRFASLPLPSEVLMAKEEISRIRASYAYVYDFNQKRDKGGFTRFPWDVAMRELGAIKARATARWKTVAGDFYDHFNMKHPKAHHT